MLDFTVNYILAILQILKNVQCLLIYYHYSSFESFAWRLLKYALIWVSLSALSGPICLSISFLHCAGVYLALFFFAPESKHRFMISFCLSVNLAVFLLLATRLWALPFNSRANCFCFCSETCFGSFLIYCSLILPSVICRAELTDLCVMPDD